MDFKITDEQELLLESLEEWIEGCGFDQRYFDEHWENAQFPAEYYKALFESPFGKVGLPEQYGGTEIDFLTMVLLDEKFAELGRPSLTTTMLNIEDIMMFGSEEQKKAISDKVDEGRLPFALGFTEPQAGSDSNGYACTATRKDGKVYINGHKSFITNASDTDLMLTMTRDFSVEPALNAMSLWMVPLNAPGVKIEPMHKIGQRMLSMCEVYLDNVEIEETDLVGEEGKGFFMLMKNFEIERVLIAATALGGAKRAYNEAVNYANERIQFGKPIGQFQLIQKMIVEMTAKIKACEAFLYATAWKYDQGESLRIDSALVKYFVTRLANEIADDCVQIMGGIGYTEDSISSKVWRDLRTARIGGGTDEILIHAASRPILKEFAKKSR